MDPSVEACENLTARAEKLGLKVKGFLGEEVTVCIATTTGDSVKGDATAATAGAAVGQSRGRRRDRIHRMVSRIKIADSYNYYSVYCCHVVCKPLLMTGLLRTEWVGLIYFPLYTCILYLPKPNQAVVSTGGKDAQTIYAYQALDYFHAGNGNQRRSMWLQCPLKSNLPNGGRRELGEYIRTQSQE